MCGDLNASVVLTGDVSAPLEIAKQKEFSIPETFVGVGNSMPAQAKNFAINLNSNSVFRGNEDELNNVLNTLAPLPDAVNEVVEVSKLFKDATVLLNEASILRALNHAEKLSNNNKAPVITLATHAFAVNYAGDINLPAMLTVRTSS